MNENIVMTAEGYGRIDGRSAGRSDLRRLTLGAPAKEENRAMEIAAQLWREGADGSPELAAELPIHQVMDLMIFLSRTLLYFREAYRMPLLYDPACPEVDRIGLQGGAMPVAVCTDNPHIDADIAAFARALGGLDELTGERMRVLRRILEEWDAV